MVYRLYRLSLVQTPQPMGALNVLCASCSFCILVYKSCKFMVFSQNQRSCFTTTEPNYYSPIAFDERVTFWLSTCLSTALCAFVCCVCNCVIVICEPYAQIMQHMHTHNAVTERVEAKKLLSRQRQSDYRLVCTHLNAFLC